MSKRKREAEKLRKLERFSHGRNAIRRKDYASQAGTIRRDSKQDKRNKTNAKEQNQANKKYEIFNETFRTVIRALNPDEVTVKELYRITNFYGSEYGATIGTQNIGEFPTLDQLDRQIQDHRNLTEIAMKEWETAKSMMIQTPKSSRYTSF